MFTFPFPLSRRQNDPPATRRPHARRRRPLVEALEGRQLLAIFTVTNANDSGSNSLRQAIISSNASSGTSTNTIDFAISNSGTDTILLKTVLPPITHPVNIDGTSEPGTGTSPRIVINGADVCPSGFSFTNQAPNSTLKGLAIVDFSSAGVVLSGSNGVKITDDYVGVMPDGTAAGNRADGILVTGKALNSTISGNVISGNSLNGVEINQGAAQTVLTGNMIGTNVIGTAALPNGNDGVLINGSSDNTVGGTVSGTPNTISGNPGDGVDLENGADANVVEGNFIGTNAAGTGEVHNTHSGVLINDSIDNTIGGSTSGAGNTISDNKGDGVTIENGANSNVVAGNRLGTNFKGTGALANFGAGVSINDSASNTVGGTTAVARNIISGNDMDGVDIDSGSKSNVVKGDYIGTDASGELPLGNGGQGVLINNGSNDNTVGGIAPGARNTISGNDEIGVKLMNESVSGGGVNSNVVEGNFIGTDAQGISNTLGNMGNKSDGLVIDYGSDGNTIGGSTAAARNIISGNNGSGVVLTTGESGAPVSSNVVEGNYIGTTLSGTVALPNGHDGVLIVGSNHNTVGGTAAGAGNTISGNQGDGVYITGTSIHNTPFFSTGNTVEGNDIGTKAGGTIASGLGNHGDGVHIDDSSGGNTIGGTAAGAGNTISGNLASGVYVYQAGQKNAIEDDVIDANGSPKTTANQCDGVWISDSQTANTLVTACTIDSNLGWGILLDTGSVAPKGITFGTGSSKNGLGTIGFD